MEDTAKKAAEESIKNFLKATVSELNVPKADDEPNAEARLLSLC